MSRRDHLCRMGWSEPDAKLGPTACWTALEMILVWHMPYDHAIGIEKKSMP
jgi:hypothetical protein